MISGMVNWRLGIIIHTQKTIALIFKSFANFVRNDFFCLQRSYRSAFENHDFDDYNISETITTTKTTIVPLGSVTLAIDESENRTRISLTVSEIFDRKHIALNAIFLYSFYSYYSYYSYYSFFPTYSLTTYLLLQEWSDPGNFDIISKLGIGRRQFLILAGKFQLVDSPWGK